MSRHLKRGRRIAALGTAGLGACAVLAACSTAQIGAAAIVGNQRITVASLDSQVSNLKVAAKPYASTMQLTSANYPSAVLSWLIRFAVMDQVAATNDISVTKAQSQAGLTDLAAVAKSNGYSSASQLLIENGVPPQLFPEAGRWDAQQNAYGLKTNGGTPPTSTAEQNAFNATLTKSQCTAAKSLDIKVSPQFGRLDYTQFSVVPAADTLSKPAGTPSPASTQGLTPAC
ncbi:MAG: SurA N-terminal domain-containing protein [Sciscionella sp.]